MVIVIAGTEEAATRLLDADDCTRLHVEASGQSPEGVRRALDAAGLGDLEDEGNARLTVAELHRRGQAEATGADWPARWQAMLDHARQKSWLSPDGTRVSAHVKY